jgi:hypothetical protein
MLLVKKPTLMVLASGGMVAPLKETRGLQPAAKTRTATKNIL